MPELPEVETVVAGLRRAALKGRRITEVRILWRRAVVSDSADGLRRKLIGRRIGDLRRRAKYICIPLDNGAWLLVHLRMTGRMLVTETGTPADAHDRAIWRLDDGRELRLHDTRKFARIYLTSGLREPPLCDLGPEPLEAGFSAGRLAAILRRARMIKPLLLDQRLIAGIGNIYADEALWEAGIHPVRRGHTLTPAEIAGLHRAIRLVLRRGLRAGGTSLGNGQTNFMTVSRQRGGNAANLQVFRRQNEPCPRCRTPLARTIVAQRATHYCPVCQKP